MRRLFSKTTLVALCLSGMGFALHSAHADDTPFLERNLDQWVEPGERLDLQQVLGLHGYNGYEVDYIEFTAQSDYGYVSVDLEMDGRYVGSSQSVGPDFQIYRVSVDQILGYGCGSLQLTVSGGPVWIGFVGSQLFRQYYPGHSNPYYPPGYRPHYPARPYRPYPGPSRPYPRLPDPYRPGPGRPGPGRPNPPHRPGPGRPGPGNPNRPGPDRPGYRPNPGPGRPGPGNPNRPGPGRPGPGGPGRPGPGRPGPHR